jgi:hypothetical protein
MEAPATAPSPLAAPVQQVEDASDVTADSETTAHHSRGVEAAIEEAAEEHNAAEEDAPVGMTTDEAAPAEAAAETTPDDESAPKGRAKRR